MISQGVLAHNEFLGNRNLLSTRVAHHGRDNLALAWSQAGDPLAAWIDVGRVLAARIGEAVEHLAEQAAVHPDLAFADLLDRAEDHLCGLRLVNYTVCALDHHAAVLFHVIGAGEDEDATRTARTQAAERVGGVLAREVEVEKEYCLL